MDTLLALLQVSDEDPSRQKKVDLVQIMVVISSGILSSTTIATVVKAWLESRKTRLTIQIDGETKKLEYEGLYLSQEVSTIQALLETLDIVNAQRNGQISRKVCEKGERLQSKDHNFSALYS